MQKVGDGIISEKYGHGEGDGIISGGEGVNMLGLNAVRYEQGGTIVRETSVIPCLNSSRFTCSFII